MTRWAALLLSLVCILWSAPSRAEIEQASSLVPDTASNRTAAGSTETGRSLDRTGADRTGADRTGADRTGADRTGDSTRHEAPSDAPVLVGELPSLPAAPAGYNSYDGGWVRFAYHPSIRQRVQPLIAKADEIRLQLFSQLGKPVLGRVAVYVARTPGEMSTLAPAGAPFPEYAAGVAYSALGLVLLTINPVHPNSNHDLEEIFRHELAHVALHDALNGAKVPRWFNEGYAVFASGEGSMNRLQTLWTATLADTLIPLAHLDRHFPADEASAAVAYAQSADVVRFLLRREERHRFRGLIERVRGGRTLEQGLELSYNTDILRLEEQWRKEVAKRYSFWPVLFSGTVVWVGALGLFVFGWRRRRRKSQETLARWAREEALEDARRERMSDEPPRVHIVLSRAQRASPGPLRPGLPEAGVPKVEHDGRWHTLH